MKLFRCFLVVNMFFATCFGASSMATESRPINYGVKGGLGMSTYSGPDVDDGVLAWRIAYGVGVFIDVPITSTIDVQVESLYVQKGATREQTALTDTIDMSATYIEFPILARLRFGNNKQVQPRILAGLSLALLMDVEATTGGEKEDITKEFSGVDAGLVFGGGLDFKTEGSSLIKIDIRYTLGLSTVDDKRNDDIYNRTVLLTLAYAFISQPPKPRKRRESWR